MSDSPRIRVMIVDDSTVIRRLLTQTLAEDPSVEVVGTAPNGKIALAKIPTLKPDVLTLDIEMPEMDGLQTLTELRKVNKTLPVIMFSTLTQRGAEGTLDALERGANDYVGKPANVGSVTEAMNRVRGEMIPKLKALCPQKGAPASTRNRIAAATPQPSTATPAPSVSLRPRDRKTRIDILAIGVSTGGPNALSTVLPALPGDFPIPIVIVQHMPPIFTKHLADRLNQKCEIEVAEAKAGDPLLPGHAWIAPGDFHMVTEVRGTTAQIGIHQGEQENSCRPAVDVLFRSVAKAYGSNTLACVLTGMGSDGLEGCKVVADKGGQIIAQDRDTSVVWGMPAAVTNAGLANQVLPLQQISSELTRHALNGRHRRQLASVGAL
ncbi:protein-glutamate methylesterase/protein-glutamine glutaminase [Rhodopirellula sallentina]|uniref:Protein-glutamate methylesterase/protein-glutamine glutaminase n=1 Tax=Rhodopirellula sallentina SM41 TaxID=1263870 RepID=M5UL97_9BACT|nr:chemotaxis response regulator protein-glutamate methylesterase [Rhodopirellula sallentina]EMI56783.1 response regulator receiver modulated CheB methylesterase [Rhodopirellula sallentina SM41]